MTKTNQHACIVGAAIVIGAVIVAAPQLLWVPIIMAALLVGYFVYVVTAELVTSFCRWMNAELYRQLAVGVLATFLIGLCTIAYFGTSPDTNLLGPGETLGPVVQPK